MANTAQIETLDTVQGVNFLTMVAAAKVFSATKLNIAEYRLTVLGEGNALIVMFTTARPVANRSHGLASGQPRNNSAPCFWSG